MSGKRLCIALLVVATIFASSAVAQDEKSEVGGPLGRTFISDQGIQNATAVSPWVSFGAGFGRISQNNQLIDGGTNPGKSKTSAVNEAGFGLDVKVWSKLSIRGEVRDFWAGEADFPLAPTGKTRQHNSVVGGGAIWRS